MKWFVLIILFMVAALIVYVRQKSFYAPPRDVSTVVPFIDPTSDTVDRTNQSNVFQDMDGFLSTREHPMSRYFQGPDLFQEAQARGGSCIDPILEPFANTTSNTLVYGYSQECVYPFTEPSERINYTQTDVYMDTAAWPNKFETSLSNVVSGTDQSVMGLESSAGIAPMTVIPAEDQYSYDRTPTKATQYTNPTYLSSLTSYDIPFIGAALQASSPSPTGSQR